MKSARPASAVPQKGSSPGSGEMFGRAEVGISSASSRSRLTILPIRGRRTPSPPKTRLYSRRISSLTSQTNVSASIQSRSKLALGFLGAICVDLSPAIPATLTDVSTTPLGPFLFFAGHRGDLRQLLSSWSGIHERFSGSFPLRRLPDRLQLFERNFAACNSLPPT